MANNIEVTGSTVKIGEKLVCLTIADARILLRELGNVIKEENSLWHYQETFTLSPDSWPEIKPYCTWDDSSGPVSVTVTTE